MIEVVEQILGYEWGTSSYDDVIVVGALILSVTCILFVINLFKSFLR